MENLSQQKHLNQIIQNLASLSLVELDQVMKRLIGLRKQKLPSVLPRMESELLKKINIPVPSEIQKRYDHLLHLRNAGTLSEEEYQELIELTGYTERLNVHRLENLVELAKVRNVPLDELIRQLELKPRLNVA